jgi:phosphopantetheinyl transferase
VPEDRRIFFIRIHYQCGINRKRISKSDTMGYLLPLSMPLYREWSIAHHSLAAIWEIDEPERFFKERTGLEPDIKFEKRRMEHLAGRFLLKHLEEDFPLYNIQPDLHDKPRIDGNAYYFSISHSWPYVAVVVSPSHECGIDIQTWHPRIEKIQHKFLSAEEQALFNNDQKLLTMTWCAKEAAYKWQGRRGIEFIDHLPIISNRNDNHGGHIEILCKLAADSPLLSIKYVMEPRFACAFVENYRITSNSDV